MATDAAKTTDINSTLRETMDLNEKLKHYRTNFAVEVSHTPTHFSIYVPEEFAHELNLRYIVEATGANINHDFFMLRVARKTQRIGVRPGKKMTALGAFEYRRMQFGSFVESAPEIPLFSRTDAHIWIKHNGECELEVSAQKKPSRKTFRRNATERKPATPNPDPIPMGIPSEVLDEADAAVVADLPNVGKRPVSRKKTKTPLQCHMESDTKILPETDPVGITKETVRLAVTTINQYLRENRNAEACLTEVDAPYHEPSDTETVQKIKLEITEIFE